VSSEVKMLFPSHFKEDRKIIFRFYDFLWGKNEGEGQRYLPVLVVFSNDNISYFESD
jgi:hypothetical protein